MFGWLYDYLDRPWRRQRRRLALDKLNTRPFVRLLETYQPEWTVCTHFLPAEIIAWLRAKTRLACRHAIVVTDLDVRAMWLTCEVDRYFVALDETRAHLECLGCKFSVNLRHLFSVGMCHLLGHCLREGPSHLRREGECLQPWHGARSSS